MQRVSLRRAGERVKGGVLFREREHPLWNPQRKAFSHCKRAARRAAMLADATSCARRCRVSIAIRFGLLLLSAAALPILWECTVISVYRQSLQCGERSNAAFGKQSAAVQTSLAPHDSKARLRVVTTCRRFMAKPCTPHPITRKGYATSVRQQSCQRLCNAQRVQLFELLSCNGGVKGQSPLRSLGGPRGPFSHVREWPPYPRPPARCRETIIILHNHNPHLRAADPRACTDQDIY